MTAPESSVPDQLDLERHRDLIGRANNVWFRRLLVLVLLALVGLALANTFGQHPITSKAQSPAASLSVRAPVRLRSGLVYELRIEIRARQTLRNANLLLGRGWLEGITLNTLEPSPSNETSDDGSLKLSLGPIESGHLFIEFIQMQVNPTTVGQRTADVSLLDGTRRVASIHRTTTVFP